jgi:hypothetical protein|tara:strand:- start:410 stop:787 length:378 start_codon:yes stop_codon:yes gene_type:complete
MSSIADRVLDSGLTTLDTEANRIDLTSAESTTFAEATSSQTLGNATSISISAPADRTASGGGRKVTLSAVSGGSITASGTATHFAISDTTNSRLLVTGALTASQSVTSGNTFALSSLDIGIPDPS